MKFVTIFFLLISFTAVSQENDWEAKADSVLQFANTQLGVPYKWGTSLPGTSFDCSGFVSYVYGSCGIEHSSSSRAYASLGEKIDLKDCRKGDCILFSGTRSKSIGHVGIVVENNEQGIKFIHCSSSKNHFGVVITDYYDSGYPKRFIEVRRMF